MAFATETEEEILLDSDTANLPVLMLYNDDVNTFHHVIESLIEICNHESTQAEQVAYIVHTKGKCDVKRDSYSRLERMCLKLLDRGLSAKIEE